MKKRETFPGKTYAVTSIGGCNVYADEAGTQLIKTLNAGQDYFVAMGAVVWIDSDSAAVVECFNSAPTSASGGGESITVDQTFSATSENPQSGKAVDSAFAKKGVKTDSRQAAIGASTTTSDYAAQVGAYSTAVDGSVALGYGAAARAYYSQALGRGASNNDIGTALICCMSGKNGTITNFYVIGANSGLANTYEGGEACLGYVVKDASGNVSACGTRKLSELLTNNTAFAPAALDLDSPAPTPFLPTGIMEPLVDPEDSKK